MKILLINPPHNADKIQLQLENFTPPLNLMYLASYLQKHEVKILDLYVHPLSSDTLSSFITNFDPLIVGIATYSPNIDCTFSTAELIKNTNKKIKIVLGGPHASYLPENCMKKPFIDFIIRGEGEVIFSHFLETFETNQDFSKIKGLVYRNGNKVIINENQPLVSDIDSLPFPDYSLIKISDYHLSPTRSVKSNSRIASIITKRGCKYRCNFCSHHYGYNYTERTRSPENVFREIILLYSDYKIREFRFDDCYFISDINYVTRICNLIIDSQIKISWTCDIRSGSHSNQLFSLMRKAGCKMFFIGAESGDQSILDSKTIQKGIKVSDTVNTVKTAQKCGIKVNCSFILGVPEDTKESLMETLKFALKLDPDYAMFSLFIPSVGSVFFEEAVKKDMIRVDDYTGAPFLILYSDKSRLINFSQFSNDELYKIMVTFNKRFYFRPKYILRKILSLKSLSDVKGNFYGALLLLRHNLKLINKFV